MLHAIDKSPGQLEVPIGDVTYYPQWTNINAARENKKIDLISFDNGHIHIVISDGYYSVCSLNDEIFKPKGISLTQNESNGMLILSAGEKQIFLDKNIANTLGFYWLNPIIDPYVTRQGDLGLRARVWRWS